jgi:hypothetical protein
MTEQTKRRIMIATYVTHVIASNIVKWALAIIIGLLLAWFMFSVSEVWAHNFSLFKDQPANYSDINLFALLANM